MDRRTKSTLVVVDPPASICSCWLQTWFELLLRGFSLLVFFCPSSWSVVSNIIFPRSLLKPMHLLLEFDSHVVAIARVTGTLEQIEDQTSDSDQIVGDST